MDGLSAASLVSFTTKLCLGGIVLRMDGELEIVRLVATIRDARARKDLTVDMQLVPRYSSQSVGAIDRPWQQLQNQIRVLMCDRR